MEFLTTHPQTMTAVFLVTPLFLLVGYIDVQSNAVYGAFLDRIEEWELMLKNHEKTICKRIKITAIKKGWVNPRIGEGK